MISGMYMGELVRLALVKFTKAGLLFGGQGSELLFKRFQFFTKYVSEIESDKPGTFMNCYDVLEEIGIGHATDEDCANVRFICECVSSRAAYLSSAGIAGLINKMNDPSVTVRRKASNAFEHWITGFYFQVGVDGSVYRFHPKFHDLMYSKIRELTHDHIKFDLMLSEDGSGRGAALVAAVASRHLHETE